MGPRVGGVFFNEINQTLEVSVSFKINRLVLLSILEEFKGGVTLDFNGGNFVGSRIDLSDDDVRVGGKLGSEFIIDGSQSLAVSAPRGVEFN